MVKKILADCCIILGGMFLTFSIINYFNDAMNFINNEISLTLLFIWSVLSMVTGGLYVADMYRADRDAASGRNAERRHTRSGADRYRH